MQKIVYLVWGSFLGIRVFLGLFLYSNTIFALFNQITKINKPGYDSNHDDDAFPDDSIVRFIFNAFSNSIADLNYPEYSVKWEKSRAMIYLIFTNYFVQIIIMVILMLNLLISVVSEKYD